MFCKLEIHEFLHMGDRLRCPCRGSCHLSPFHIEASPYDVECFRPVVEKSSCVDFEL